MYFLIASGDASPTEHTKYPSLNNVFSFQKCPLRNALCFLYILKVEIDLKLFTISKTDFVGE